MQEQLNSESPKIPYLENKPDAWIYNRSVLSWLFEPSLSNQLPLLYQIFSLYCYLYFQLTTENYLRGGKELFQFLATLLNNFSSESYLKFKISDYEVFLDPFDARFFQVVNELASKDAETRVLQTLLSEGDTFIDIGANHGSFSIVASKLVGANGLVISIEPQPRLASAVEKSVTANALCNFQVYQLAVGDFEGEIDLLIPRGTSGSAGIYPEHSATHKHQIVKVKIRRFEELVDWPNFPGKVLIKLDIEGSECAFLLGAKKLITALKPNLIIEIHPGTLAAAKTTGEELKQLLESLGYHRYAEMNDLAQTFPLEELSTEVQRNVVMMME